MLKEFVRGWRRKVGILTLLMALVAMPGRFAGRSLDGPDIDMRWCRWGFGGGELKVESIVRRTVPYWSLITPLWAWLLLFKRSKPESKYFK